MSKFDKHEQDEQHDDAERMVQYLLEQDEQHDDAERCTESDEQHNVERMIHNLLAPILPPTMEPVPPPPTKGSTTSAVAQAAANVQRQIAEVQTSIDNMQMRIESIEGLQRSTHARLISGFGQRWAFEQNMLAGIHRVEQHLAERSVLFEQQAIARIQRVEWLLTEAMRTHLFPPIASI